MTVALVTGASRGLGRSLAEALAERGWSLVIDGRDPVALAEAAASIRSRLGRRASLVAVEGDVADEHHRRDLVATACELGGLDVLVNNASTIGPSPLRLLASYPLNELRRVYEVNTMAPLGLLQLALPLLERSEGPVVINVTSDASVEHYDTWGGYGSSKAALDHLTGTLQAELPGVRFVAVDPGDMRTAMHQAAFPGEDISDRPLPDEVVPSLLQVIEDACVAGRIRAADLGTARLEAVR